MFCSYPSSLKLIPKEYSFASKVKVGEAQIIVISKIFLTFPQKPVPTPLRGYRLRQMVVVRLSVWWLGVRGLAAFTLADGVRAGQFSSPCWGEDCVRMGMAGQGPEAKAQELG